jgi:hypothetical protein
MDPFLHVVFYAGAAVIAMLSGFDRVLHEHQRQRGLALLAFALLLGVDTYVWLFVNEQKIELLALSKIVTHIPWPLALADWPSTVSAFLAALFLGEAYKTNSNDYRKFALGLACFAIYSFSVVAYWLLLAFNFSPATRDNYYSLWTLFRDGSHADGLILRLFVWIFSSTRVPEFWSTAVGAIGLFAVLGCAAVWHTKMTLATKGSVEGNTWRWMGRFWASAAFLYLLYLRLWEWIFPALFCIAVFFFAAKCERSFTCLETWAKRERTDGTGTDQPLSSAKPGGK